MKSEIKISLLFLIIGLVIGGMVGISMDPVDRAIRKAQKINKSSLKHVQSFRSRKTQKSIQESMENDPIFHENHIKRLQAKIKNKNKSIQILDETKEFIDLATQEVFIDNSLHRYLLSLGRIQLQNGMFFESIKNLERAYKLNPSHPSTPNLLAKNYLRIYQVLPEGEEKNNVAKNAIHFFKIQIDSNIQDLEAMQGLAMIYAATGRYNESLTLFQYILEKNPEDIESNLGIAAIYYKTNDFKEAKRIYEDIEALILEIKRKGRLWRHPTITRSQLDKKLRLVQHNLEIIQKKNAKFERKF